MCPFCGHPERQFCCPQQEIAALRRATDVALRLLDTDVVTLGSLDVADGVRGAVATLRRVRQSAA